VDPDQRKGRGATANQSTGNLREKEEEGDEETQTRKGPAFSILEKNYPKQVAQSLKKGSEKVEKLTKDVHERERR